MLLAKPSAAAFSVQSSLPLNAGHRGIIPFVEGTGLPKDYATGTAGTLGAGIDAAGTTDPAWTTGDFGPELTFIPTDKALTFPGAGNTATGTSSPDGDFSAAIVFQGPTDYFYSVAALDGSAGLMTVFGDVQMERIGAGAVAFSPALTMASGHRTLVVFSLSQADGLLTGYLWDFDAAVPTLRSGTLPWTYGSPVPIDPVINPREGFAFTGSVSHLSIWSGVALSSSQAMQIAADPAVQGRAPSPPAVADIFGAPRLR